MKFLQHKKCKIFGSVLAVLTLLFFMFLSFILYTTTGARFALSITQLLLDENKIVVDADIKDGSVVHGLKLDNLIVDVKDVVIVKSDEIKIDSTGLYDVLVHNSYIVNSLFAKNLQVILTIKSKEIEDTIENTLNLKDDSIFILNFPVNIYIHKLILDNFAYLSDIVDVKVKEYEGAARAFKNNAIIDKAKTRDVSVHLKLENRSSNTKNAQDIKNSEHNNKDNKALDNTFDDALSKKIQDNQKFKIKDNTKDTKHDVKAQDTHIDKKEASYKKSNVDNDNKDFAFSGREGQIAKLYTIHMPLNAYIGHLEIQDGRYYQDGFDTELFDGKVSASFEDSFLKVNYVDIKHALGEFKVSGSMLFEDYYTLDFKVEGQGNNDAFTKNRFDGIFYNLKGSAKVEGDLCSLSSSINLKTPDTTLVKVKLNALSDDLFIDAKIDSKKIVWPLNVPESEIKGSVSNLKLSLLGSLINKFNLNLDSNLSGYGFNNFKTQLQSSGSLRFIDIKKLKLQGMYEKSNVDSSFVGLINFADAFLLDGKINASLTDASFISEILKGPLNLKSDLAFSLDTNDIQNSLFDIKHISFIFNLNDEKAHLISKNIVGSLHEGLEVEELAFSQGSNIADLKGVIGDISTLSGNINFYNLKRLYKDLKGDFVGSFNVQGAIDSLDINLNAKSHIFAFHDILMRELNLNSFINTKDLKVGVLASMSSLKINNNLGSLYQCVLDVQGNEAKHRTSFICSGNNTVYLDYKGGIDKSKNLYKGAINEFILNNKGLSLTLSKKADINYAIDSNKGSVSKILITGNLGDFIVDETLFESNLFTTKFNLKDIKLRQLRNFMPKGYSTTGFLNADGFILVENNNTKIDANLKTDNFVFRMPDMVLPFKHLNYSLKGHDNKLENTLDFALKRNLGQGRVDLNIYNIDSKKDIKGSINVDSLDLNIVSQLGHVFNDIDGTLNVNTKLSGNLLNPLLHGNINIKGSAEPRYDIGQIEKFNFNIKAMGHEALLNGAVNLNGQNLDLNGSLSWLEGAFGNLHFKAKRLPAFLLGNGSAFADIDVNAHFKESIKVKGTVHIPEAIITPKGLSDSLVPISKDEVIVGANGLNSLERKKKDVIESEIYMNLSLGDKVVLKAMGLEANVLGGIDILKDKDASDFNATGRIYLENGKIDLYGHHFHVVKANTNFNGNIVNPILDVEVLAEKDDLEDDVEVGIKVLGAASDPKIELFSRPAMSQNEILSYILYGHGLEKSSSSQDLNNGTLLLGLGLSSTTGLVSSLVSVFGIQDVQLGTQGSGDEAQVSVQGNITRKIKVSYGYGIYNAVSEFKLRYELLRKLYVEFISSVDQAVDLVYSFEFN